MILDSVVELSLKLDNFTYFKEILVEICRCPCSKWRQFDTFIFFFNIKFKLGINLEVF